MLRVELTEDEWTRLLNCAALAPFNQVSPLLGKVTDQLVRQQQAMRAPPAPVGDKEAA